YDHLAHFSFLRERSIQDSELEFVSLQPGLETAAFEPWVQILCGQVDAADAEQFGPRLLAKYSRRRRTRDSGDDATLQRPIDVHGPARDDLGARGDAADDRHVAFGMLNRLPG